MWTKPACFRGTSSFCFYAGNQGSAEGKCHRDQMGIDKGQDNLQYALFAQIVSLLA